MNDADVDLVRYDYFAERLGLGPKTIKVYAQTDEFPKPHIVVGAVPYFLLSVADDYIEQRMFVTKERGRPAKALGVLRPPVNAKVWKLSEVSPFGAVVGYEYFAKKLGVQPATIRNQTRALEGFPKPVSHIPGRGKPQPRFDRDEADAFIQSRLKARAERESRR